MFLSFWDEIILIEVNGTWFEGRNETNEWESGWGVKGNGYEG